MKFKSFLILIMLLYFFYGCAINKFQKLNFVENIFDLENLNIVPPDEKEQKNITLYRDKYNRIIHYYNGYYGFWYQIRKGDSLYKIARLHNISVNLLASVNKLSKNSYLNWLDSLFIPVSTENLDSYEKIEISFTNTKFIWPVWGRITSGFGLRHKRFHKGLDIAAPLGTKVIAADNGIVKFSGRVKKYGYVVILQHSDYFETRYAHLSKILVNNGDKVQKGEIIGFIGKTGRATGYHLHFEIRIDNEPVDPLKFLPSTPTKIAEIYLEEKLRGLRP